MFVWFSNNILNAVANRKWLVSMSNESSVTLWKLWVKLRRFNWEICWFILGSTTPNRSYCLAMEIRLSDLFVCTSSASLQFRFVKKTLEKSMLFLVFEMFLFLAVVLYSSLLLHSEAFFTAVASFSNYFKEKRTFVFGWKFELREIKTCNTFQLI